MSSAGGAAGDGGDDGDVAFGEGEVQIDAPPWLPQGWKAVERPREVGGHADRFYYSPHGVRLRSRPEVERFLAGKPTLDSLAKGAPRPPPLPPACPVEQLTAVARELLAKNRALAGRAAGAAGAEPADDDAAAGAAPHFLAAAAARAPPPLAPPPAKGARGSKRRMEVELEALGRQLCVRGALQAAARLRRDTHLPLLRTLPKLQLATPLADALDPWPRPPLPDAAAGGKDE